MNMKTENKTYPYLEYANTEGYNMVVNGFLRIVNIHIPKIRSLYESLKLGLPFDDNVWDKLSNRPDFARDLYNAKIDKVIEALNLPAGVPEIASLRKENPVLVDLINEIKYFESQLSASPSVNYKNYFKLWDISNVAGTPEIKESALKVAEEKFKTYINSRDEDEIKNALDEHAASYSKLWTVLIEHGYNMLPFTRSHLDALYQRDDENNFITLPGTATLIANIRERNARLSGNN